MTGTSLPRYARPAAVGWRTAAVALLVVGGVRGCIDSRAAAAEPPPVAAVQPASRVKLTAKPQVAAAATAQPASPALPAVAAPKPSSAEAEYKARLDQLLAPLTRREFTAQELPAIKTAFDAAAMGNIAAAKSALGQITDPLILRLVEWAYYRSDALAASAADIEAYRVRNPRAAEQELLRQRAEESLFLKAEPAAILAFFAANGPPQTGAGHAAQGAALIAQGDTARGHAALGKAWRQHDFSPKIEEVIRGRLAGALSAEDHRWRLNRLLLSDIRWADQRRIRANAVGRMLTLLAPAEQEKAKARLASYLKSPNAKQALAKLPETAFSGPNADWGLVYHRIQQLRRDKQYAAAAKLLLTAPIDPEKIVNPDDWWVERRVNAYETLNLGDAATAYRLVANAGPLTVNPLKDQQFMAGWIALRYLNRAKDAETHFLAMAKAADGPLSAAKAHYWLARTYEAQGNKAAAREHLKRAAPYYDTFYGQLARQTLEPRSTQLRVGLPDLPSQGDVANFLALDVAQGVAIARKAGLPNLVRTFLRELGYRAPTPGELVLAAHLSDALGDTQMAVRLGKHGIAKGWNVAYYSYPTHTMPGYQPLRPSPEPAFLLGIARQESEFNTLTLSGAGARGILQVMPVTARHVCRDYHIKCDIARLMSDPSYNTAMGAAYIADRMKEFADSYVLTLAGYNAGPGRARQWIKAFGDPRDPKLDPVDWIERIPFEETREYVKKVLSNIQVYRARLGGETTALRIAADLYRARGRTEVLPSPWSAQDEGGAGGRGGAVEE